MFARICTLALTLTLAGCASSCATTSGVPDDCLVLDPPEVVICSDPTGRIGTMKEARMICQLRGPDRWIRVHPDGTGLVVVGGNCFTLQQAQVSTSAAGLPATQARPSAPLLQAPAAQPAKPYEFD